MNNTDRQYKELIEKILTEGVKKSDRTGTGTISVFGHQMRFKMSEGFPLLTLRKIHTRSVIHELLWFLGAFDEQWQKFGNTNIRYLLQQGVTFWSEWPHKEYIKQLEYNPGEKLTLKQFEERIKLDDDFAMKFGSIGPGYGEQWLNSGSLEMMEIIDNKVEEVGDNIVRRSTKKITKLDGINQIDSVIDTLKKNPDSRRMIVDSWNPMRIDEMLLPPCHLLFQFYSSKIKEIDRYHLYNKWIKENGYNDIGISHSDGMKHYKFPERELSLQLYIRSQDCYLGNPFNVSEYSLLLHMISQVTNMIPKELVYTIGDAHLYNNSIDAVKEICERDSYPLPKLMINQNIKSIYDFRYDDIRIEDYQSHPNIKVEVAV